MKSISNHFVDSIMKSQIHQVEKFETWTEVKSSRKKRTQQAATVQKTNPQEEEDAFKQTESTQLETHPEVTENAR